MTEWPATAIGNVARVNPPKPKYAELHDDDFVGFVPMAAVDEVSGEISVVEERPLGAVRAKSYRTFAPGDVLFAKITPCMENGKAATVPELPNGHGFGSTEFHVLRPGPEVDAHYLWNFLRQKAFRAEAEKNMTGSVGQARVPASFLRDTVIPLPPILEQHRIVEYLASVNDYTGTAAKHLAEARRIVNSANRSLYHSACTGRLTEDWRRENVEGADGDVPIGWKTVRIKDIAECLDRLRKPVNNAERAKRQGIVPYYGANGQVGWIDEALFDEPLVLVVEDETFTGRTKPFSYLISGPSWVNNHAHVLRAGDEVSPEALNVLLSFYDFIPLTSGSTGRRKLNQRSLMEAELLLPPILEQREIVRRVDEALRNMEQIRDQLDRVTSMLQRTAQAAATKIFGRDLVAPAEVAD
ncbi:restriction endonuclease subunit S [Streptomyces griseoincarnatus]|uniref:Restriction endonuclease subunit S n=1 Tax=Streptomyces griseoincarnatus TaxID=29305 RepID=A0ABT0VSC6_STRGI|nr:restriction endonuclease subunit S [Streptomyces griseoincarnatus]MCM2514259.1 restriction endonuclease subunit S [Streptomyces griseoincarnatus]